MDAIFLGLSGAQWLDLGLSIGLIVAAVLLGRRLVQIISKQFFGRLARKTQTTLDDVLLEIFRLPLYLMVVGVSLQVAYTRLDFWPAHWNNWVGDVFFVLYLIIGFIFAWRFVHYFFIWYGAEIAQKTETELDEQLMPFFRRIAMVILWLIGLITLLGHFNVDVSAMVATLGIGSLAIALAAQEALADTISGFIIMVDRPFRLGDRIELLDLNTWGDVVDIGLRSSRIRTRDNRMVIVPNSVIGKSLIVNHSYPDEKYRLEVHIGLAYGTDIEYARSVMVAAVQKVDGVLDDHPVEALFLEFGDSALIFRVRWWLDSYVDTRRMFDAVNSALYKALNDAQIEIPFPQRDVHLKYPGPKPQ